MTGHGQALVEDDQVQAVAEVRTVNNRFLKLNLNCDLDAKHNAQLEALVKKHVNRGSVNLRIKTQVLDSSSEYQLDTEVIQSYLNQLQSIGHTASADRLLNLPGIVKDSRGEGYSEKIWPVVEKAAEQALEKLMEMRSREGDAMQKDLQSNCQAVAEQVEKIEGLAPRVGENYAKRITDRINGLLEKYEVSVQPSELVREVGVFAERCDISEELVRLKSHLQQFQDIFAAPESSGRKLDVLTQELLRETNTIGSKANDADIAGHVVEIKTVIERIREMVQNVE